MGWLTSAASLATAACPEMHFVSHPVVDFDAYPTATLAAIEVKAPSSQAVAAAAAEHDWLLAELRRRSDFEKVLVEKDPEAAQTALRIVVVVERVDVVYSVSESKDGDCAYEVEARVTSHMTAWNKMGVVYELAGLDGSESESDHGTAFIGCDDPASRFSDAEVQSSLESAIEESFDPIASFFLGEVRI